MSFNFITAAEAASYIKDGDIVGLSGFKGRIFSDWPDYRSFDGRFL